MSFGELFRKYMRNIGETCINVREAYLSEVDALDKTFYGNTAFVDSTNYYTWDGRIGAAMASIFHPIKELRRMRLMAKEYKAEIEAFERHCRGE
jgi:hypothetical protein